MPNQHNLNNLGTPSTCHKNLGPIEPVVSENNLKEFVQSGLKNSQKWSLNPQKLLIQQYLNKLGYARPQVPAIKIWAVSEMSFEEKFDRQTTEYSVNHKLH